MGGTHFRLRHVVGAASLSCAVLLAGLTVGLPAAAQTAPTMVASCPVLSLGNPGPGDNIFQGDMIISGQAYDPAATSGSGITRVDLFLGRRDEGGIFLGSAVPGTADNPRAFSTKVTIPSNFNSGAEFAAYAISAVSGTETTVTFPITVGTPARNPNSLVTPTPTVNPVPNVTNNCPKAPAGATQPAASAPAASAPAAAASPAAPSAPAASTAANSCPVLSLGNPNPGDKLTPGNMFISGVATAPGGVTRVDLFLGERDQGGTFLGSGIPGTGSGDNPAAFNVEVKVPALGRGLDFAAYAIGANGQEQVVTFPVLVGPEPTRTSVGPTPTPIPTTRTVTSTCH
jgi:hypothetical protein